jgi:hypothetical protein
MSSETVESGLWAAEMAGGREPTGLLASCSGEQQAEVDGLLTQLAECRSALAANAGEILRGMESGETVSLSIRTETHAARITSEPR